MLTINLRLASITILLIVVSNPSILNPGPAKFNGIKRYFQNVQGLVTFSSVGKPFPDLNQTKISELQTPIFETSPDVVIFNETWLKPTIKSSEILSTDIYKIFRLDRTAESHPPDPENPHKFKCNGGGVLKGIKKSLNLNPKLLKQTCKAEVLLLSFKTGSLPADWKLAHVVPTHKKGDKNYIENYRPISLTSIIPKLFEKCIRDELLLECQKFLHDSQHGFLPLKSCITQLVPFSHDISIGLNSNNLIDVIYFDFAKAFDTVNDDIILLKLKNEYKIDGLMVKFVKEYLHGRIQRVAVNGTLSDTRPVKSGVPQGKINNANNGLLAK